MGLRPPAPSTADGRAAATSSDFDRRLRQLERTLNGGLQWVALPYSKNWKDYSTSPGVHVVGQYSKDRQGIVRIKGLVQCTETYAINDIIATLPEGFRPGKQVILSPCMYNDTTNTGLVRVDARTDGSIRIEGTIGTTTNTRAGNSWISLNNLEFVASLG